MRSALVVTVQTTSSPSREHPPLYGRAFAAVKRVTLTAAVPSIGTNTGRGATCCAHTGRSALATTTIPDQKLIFFIFHISFS